MSRATKGRLHLAGRSTSWQLIMIAAACVVVACAGESDRGPLPNSNTGGGTTSSGTGGGTSSGQGGNAPVDPFGDEDDIYVIAEDTPSCEYAWILPGCNKEAGESCYTALDCLPTCCSCPDGSVYGAGACDYEIGADAGTCAYPSQVCGNTDQSCG